MLDLSTPQVFHPEKSSRRTELVAWIFALLMFIPVNFVALGASPFLHIAAWFFLIFFGLSAAILSFGNWVERRTSLILDQDGITFKNGIRETRFLWQDINKVEVGKGSYGRVVVVFGEITRFIFHTFGEITYKGKVGAKGGFMQGENILDAILAKTGLTEQSRQENTHEGTKIYLSE